MNDPVELAMSVDIAAAATAAEHAAIEEVGRQADALLGTDPLPGTPEWHAEEGTDLPARRQLAWQLVCLRIQLAAGIESTETVMSLRRFGTTWAVIGQAAGMSRQSAHERWGAKVSAILDRYGDGMPDSVPNDDPTHTPTA